MEKMSCSFMLISPKYVFNLLIFGAIRGYNVSKLCNVNKFNKI